MTRSHLKERSPSDLVVIDYLHWFSVFLQSYHYDSNYANILRLIFTNHANNKKNHVTLPPGVYPKKKKCPANPLKDGGAWYKSD